MLPIDWSNRRYSLSNETYKQLRRMPITAQQQQGSQAIQHTAAHDGAQQVRLVAGPGTGKSFCIEERVLWLLQKWRSAHLDRRSLLYPSIIN
jgi:flagellar biosynthesis/type III secretory pathway ATPase